MHLGLVKILVDFEKIGAIRVCLVGKQVALIPRLEIKPIEKEMDPQDESKKQDHSLIANSYSLKDWEGEIQIAIGKRKNGYMHIDLEEEE